MLRPGTLPDSVEMFHLELCTSFGGILRLQSDNRAFGKREAEVSPALASALDVRPLEELALGEVVAHRFGQCRKSLQIVGGIP